MIVAVEPSSAEQEPVRQPCSLLEDCRIEPGTSDDYHLLSRYHYRGTGFPPAAHQVYRARHVPTGRTVGVMVYAAPALNLSIRNQIFGDRYKIGGTPAQRKAASDRVNEELELLIRIIVHPTFRGIGLGVRMIKETLPLRRKYRFVEMSAAMGELNPFAEKAGMKSYRVAKNPATERVLAALRSVGMRELDIANPASIMRRLETLSPHQREMVEEEMRRYERRWILSRTNRKVKLSAETAAKRIAANALLTSVYYLWENPGWQP